MKSSELMGSGEKITAALTRHVTCTYMVTSASIMKLL